MWKDAIEEIFEKKAWLGFNFGKPFHSKNVEILGWSKGDEIGWLHPHNSYINILYRAGLVGLIFVFLIWLVSIKLIVMFTKMHDVVGIFLSSALLYWLLLANFIVFLESPYFAILFWSFLGMVLAYMNQKKRSGAVLH